MVHRFFHKSTVALAAGSVTVDFMFVVPPHLVHVDASMRIRSGSECQLELWEGATTSNDGTPISLYDVDRNCAGVPDLQAYANPTITAMGTKIWSSTLSAQSVAEVNSDVNYDIIPRFNTKYIWRVVKSASQASWVDVDFFWWEARAGEE